VAIGETLEQEITKLVQSIMESREQEVTQEEVTKIVKELLPGLEEVIDKKVADRVIYHFKVIAEFILSKLPEEGSDANAS